MMPSEISTDETLSLGAPASHDGRSTRAARSREKLLRAATDLLVDAGPRGVTVDAVAEASGVAKSTLYRHWASRDDMLVDVVRCNMPDVAAPDLSRGFEHALRTHLHEVAVTLQSPDWSRIVPALMMLRTTMPELASIADADHRSKSAMLRQLIDAGVESGDLAPTTDPAHVEAMLYGPMIFVTLTGNDVSLVDLAAAIADRFLAGARAECD